MQKTSGKSLRYAAQTDVGKSRDHNEDCYRVNEDLGLFVVADGMGGHASGEVASGIAVNTVEQEVVQGAGLVEAIERAHLAIIEGVKQGVGKHGMGTTVVALQLHGDEYTLAWVGDSRAYLWDDRLMQISKDHSLVQMLLDSGKISEAEAQIHPRKNIIYQNLGAEELEQFQVSVKNGSLYKNQKLILCSDGLSDEVDNEKISEIMQRCTGDDEAVEELIAAAIDSGGHDNITVILISATDSAPDKAAEDFSGNGVSRDTLVPQN